MRSVDTGMTTSDVRQILGTPDGVRSVEDHEVYVYSNRRMSGWSNDKADYSVVFSEGRVIQYGPGEVRP